MILALIIQKSISKLFYQGLEISKGTHIIIINTCVLEGSFGEIEFHLKNSTHWSLTS